MNKSNINNVRKGGVKIIIRNFQKKIPINPARIKKTILKVLSSERAVRPCEITVSFVNPKMIKELNKRFLGIDKPTDVLAFDLTSAKKDNFITADIIISADEAYKNARIFGTSASYELNLYAAHGTLHILGYDDRTQKQIRLMREKEREYVNT